MYIFPKDLVLYYFNVYDMELVIRILILLTFIYFRFSIIVYFCSGNYLSFQDKEKVLKTVDQSTMHSTRHIGNLKPRSQRPLTRRI